MIDTSQILTQADQYAFSLFNPDLIDFDMLENDKYGIISLPLITSKLPKPNEPFDNEDTMMMICDAIDFGDMWFTYDPIHHRVEELVIECMCIQQQISCDSAIYFMGQAKHPEYDKYTLDGEYRRDINKGLDIQPPKNYYPNDDPNREPIFRWRAHAHLLYHNWLNYYVYQNTPYDLKDLTGLE